MRKLMKKILKTKTIICLVVVALILGSTACSSSKSSTKNSAVKEKKETFETVEQTKLSKAANQVLEEKLNEFPESGKKAVELLKKYVDFNAYMLDDGIIYFNQTTEDISSIEVDGTIFKLGMNYEEVISKGYTPKDSSYADSKKSNKDMEFTNSKGNSVELRFDIEDGSDKSIKEIGVLYEIKVNVKNQKFLFKDLDETSTISDIIETLGKPYEIGASEDYSEISMKYIRISAFQNVEFYNDSETEKITSVDISGSVQKNKTTEELNDEKEQLKEYEKIKQKTIKMMKKYFDVDLYRIERTIDDNKVDKDLSSIEINGEKFKLGMSYKEVISMGYKPDDTSFAKKKPQYSEFEFFENSKGNRITLSFETTDNPDKTIEEAGILSEISMNTEMREFIFDSIKKDSTVSDIIEAFGNPYSIGVDLTEYCITYKDREDSYLARFYINPETEKITNISIDKKS